MEISKNDLKQIYSKANAAFIECITCRENEFLRDEIDIPIDLITTKEEFVRVQFYKSEVNVFVIEANIQLLAPDGKLIGTYSYYEDETGSPVDDRLTFI